MSTRLDRLSKFFKLGFDFKTTDNSEKIFPIKKATKKDEETNQEREIFVKEAFPSKVQGLFDWWISNNQVAVNDYKNMSDLYQDCDLMYYNCALVARAIEVVADEIIQGGTGVDIIKVEAKSKQKKFLKDFHKNINLESFLRPIAVDLVQYGNALWIHSFNEKGIDEIIPVEIKQLKERLEFTPFEVETEKAKGGVFDKYINSSSRIQTLVDMITNKDNISTYFKRYLFGFKVGEVYLPPWRVSHFRNTTTKSPFAPFGVPFFIHSIAPYKQYDSGLTMQMTSRGINFPKDVYKLNFPETMVLSEKLAKAQEFSMKLQNSGINAVAKEINGVGEVIITIKDLYEYTQETPNLDLGKVDDIEMLRNDIIVSLFLPRNLVDPNDSGFGDSGVSLVEKFKIFAKLIYRAQSLILEQITQMDKIHMLYSGEFELDEIDFMLSMPYPESLTNSELVQTQEEIFSLIDTVVTSLQDKFLGGDPLPNEVLKSIFTKFLPYDSNLLDFWFKKIRKAQKQKATEMPIMPPTEGEGGEDFSGGVEGIPDFGSPGLEAESADIDNELASNEFVAPTEEETEGGEQLKASKEIINNKEHFFEKRGQLRWEKLLEQQGKQKLQEQIEEIIFEAKQESLTEGVLHKRHFYSSKSENKLFDIKLMREIDLERFKRLKESDNNKFKVFSQKNLNEEVDSYSFEESEEIKEEIKDEEEESLDV